MKLIKQSFEILEQKDFSLVGIKKFIEKCGRVCYKSEDRITDNSYEGFVDMLKSKDYSRPLEMGTVHLKMPWKNFNNWVGFCIKYHQWDSTWIKYNLIKSDKEALVYITTNYRYYLQLSMLNKMHGYFPLSSYFDAQDNDLYPKRYTVHMILPKGTMDEFRTHVGLSHLAEDTRYCNYNKDKSDIRLTFILPSWITLETDISNLNELCLLTNQYDRKNAPQRYLASLLDSEFAYLSFIDKGWDPQQAREVLPLSVKSELISCGFADAWANFFYRRCAKNESPMAREVAVSVLNKFKQLGYLDLLS